MNLGASLPMLNRRLRALSVGSSGMELAAVPLPPFVSCSACDNRKRCEDFISTIYSTIPATMTATHSSHVDDDVAEKRVFPLTASEFAAERTLWNGRKEIHDGKN